MRNALALSRTVAMAFTLAVILFAGLEDSTTSLVPKAGGTAAALAAPLVCTECPCPNDPQCDGIANVLDVVQTTNAAFRGTAAVSDPGCPQARADNNCDGCIDARDLVLMLDAAFRGADPATTFCDPCVCITTPQICVEDPVQSSGSIVIESKLVAPGATGVQIGVFVDNDVDIEALVLPLEIRSIDPGAYVTGSFAFAAVNGNRLNTSPLGSANPNGPPAGITSRKFAAAAAQSCSGPTSNSYSAAAAQIDFVSPDAVLYATVSQGTPPTDDITLDGGFDPAGFPSLRFTFDVTSTAGSFVIDTCCVTPCNHLSMVDAATTDLISPAFTPGIITIGTEVSFYGTPSQGNVPHTVFFTEVNTSGTPVTARSWTFGDGGTSTLQNPVHIYTTTGIFDVTLTVTQLGTPIPITRNNYIHVTAGDANFSATPLHGDNPLSVDFTDLTPGSPTMWLWEFGDNETSTDQNPTHVYASDGDYDVKLTASSGAASSTVELKLDYIHVGDPESDFHVDIFFQGRPQPGFPVGYNIRLLNVGHSTLPASTLTLTLPSILTPSTVNPPGTVNGNVVTWTTPILDPYTFGVPYSITSTVPIGTLDGTELTATVTIPAAPSETNLANNSATDQRTVVVSSDPNDLIVSPPGCGSGAKLYQGEPRLSFTAHFENKPEATANAFYVLILDTLDPDLDWSTLQFGPTSHDAVVDIDFDATTGEISWFFDGIELPPNDNPPEGEGYVTYSISPNPGLPDGTVFSNRAHIRFDFNDWIPAPNDGPLDLLVAPCPPCDCPCANDPQCDGVISSVLDVTRVIDVAFRGIAATLDPECPRERTDVDCSGNTNVLDVTNVIDVAFPRSEPGDGVLRPMLVIC